MSAPAGSPEMSARVCRLRAAACEKEDDSREPCLVIIFGTEISQTQGIATGHSIQQQRDSAYGNDEEYSRRVASG